MKQVASHFGGTRNGLVMSWPKSISERGGMRSQFHHIIDIAPTILEAAGVAEPRELYERLRSPLLHCTHDGLERQSRSALTRQQLTVRRNGM